MELKNYNFLVYGAGVSGLSAYKFLKEHNAKVHIYSDKTIENCENMNILKKFSDVMNLKFDYVVLSPGINIIGNKNLKKLKENGALFLSELELGYLFCKGKFIAVTGTNGKTTCVHLLDFILSKKHNTFLCGNVGTPITSICDKTDENSIVICEVSSFMLEMTSKNFAPDVACILNITPDHISRHKSFENYYRAKIKITQSQNFSQFFVIPKELENVESLAKKIIVSNKKCKKTHLIGDFNAKNINFCLEICKLFNFTEKEFYKHLKSFYPLKFRLQLLGRKNKVTYINDSKSTNTDSTVKALESMKKPVILLLGGSDKGCNFYEIFKLKDKIKIAIIYGQTADKLEEDALFMGYFNTVKFDNLNESLKNINNYISKKDIVLFSPACASFDEFNNYVERGEFFNNFYEEQ